MLGSIKHKDVNELSKGKVSCIRDWQAMLRCHYYPNTLCIHPSPEGDPETQRKLNRLQIAKTVFQRRGRMKNSHLWLQNPVQSYDIQTVVLVSAQTHRPKQLHTLYTYIRFTMCYFEVSTPELPSSLDTEYFCQEYKTTK